MLKVSTFDEVCWKLPKLQVAKVESNFIVSCQKFWWNKFKIAKIESCQINQIQLKYGFWKQSIRKYATLNSWTLSSSQKGTYTNES